MIGSELEKACLNCTLPICDDKDAECLFVQITRSVPGLTDKGRERLAIGDHIMALAAQNMPHFLAEKEKQVEQAALGFKKYDKRRKSSRGYWRDRKK